MHILTDKEIRQALQDHEGITPEAARAIEKAALLKFCATTPAPLFVSDESPEQTPQSGHFEDWPEYEVLRHAVGDDAAREILSNAEELIDEIKASGGEHEDFESDLELPPLPETMAPELARRFRVYAAMAICTDREARAADVPCRYPGGWAGLLASAVIDELALSSMEWPENEAGFSIQRATAGLALHRLKLACEAVLDFQRGAR